MRDGNQGNRENIETMLKLVVAGKLNPTISKVYPMKQFMHVRIARTHTHTHVHSDTAISAEGRVGVCACEVGRS